MSVLNLFYRFPYRCFANFHIETDTAEDAFQFFIVATGLCKRTITARFPVKSFGTEPIVA